MKLSLVGTTGYDNWTALHYACYNNSEKCVRLFLAHPQCTTNIVKRVNSDGKTAEMFATNHGYHGCAKLIRNFIDDSQTRSSSVGATSSVNPAPSSSPARPPPPHPSTRTPPPSASSGGLTIAQLSEAIDNIEVDKQGLRRTRKLRQRTN